MLLFQQLQDSSTKSSKQICKRKSIRTSENLEQRSKLSRSPERQDVILPSRTYSPAPPQPCNCQQFKELSKHLDKKTMDLIISEMN